VVKVLDMTATKQVQVVDDDDQVLVMLVPASSVRWGKSWADSSANTMDWMLKNYHSNQNTPGYLDNSDDAQHHHGNSSDAMWLEIGCSIFRAQLVKNVTFSS
jgi:hypothetical protein